MVLVERVEVDPIGCNELADVGLALAMSVVSLQNNYIQVNSLIKMVMKKTKGRTVLSPQTRNMR